MPQYNDNPQSIGEHLRKARIMRKLLQKEVATLLHVSEDTLTFWENERTQPQVHHYPAIIVFLGYYPFQHDTETIHGKLQYIRYCNGFNFKQCASLLQVSVDAVKRWERGRPVMQCRMRRLIETVYEQQYADHSQHPF